MRSCGMSTEPSQYPVARGKKVTPRLSLTDATSTQTRTDCTATAPREPPMTVTTATIGVLHWSARTTVQTVSQAVVFYSFLRRPYVRDDRHRGRDDKLRTDKLLFNFLYGHMSATTINYVDPQLFLNFYGYEQAYVRKDSELRPTIFTETPLSTLLLPLIGRPILPISSSLPYLLKSTPPCKPSTKHYTVVLRRTVFS